MNDLGSSLLLTVSVVDVLAAFVRWALPLVIGVGGLASLSFYVLSLPLRREERARFLIDFMQSSFKEREAVEPRLVSLSRSGEASIGVRFHLLAAHLERGQRLGSALEKVPSILPPQVRATLRVGEAIGDVEKVLPACREMLRDGISQTRAAINYHVVLALVLNPMALLLLFFWLSFMGPRVGGWAGTFAPPGMPWVEFVPYLFAVQLALVLVLYVCALIFIGGPRFVEWLQAGLPPLADNIFIALPWRRKRMQRDFAAMLALLLDAGVPEPKAVALAAESTGNAVFVRRGKAAIERLRAGESLPEALTGMKDAGEFRWRLANGTAGNNFQQALRGWGTTLSARAFQQEQGLAQIFTTMLALLNGLTVLILTGALFVTLRRMLEFQAG